MRSLGVQKIVSLEERAGEKNIDLLSVNVNIYLGWFLLFVNRKFALSH